MISGMDASTDRFLSALGKINSRIEKAQREVSSGKKLEFASDAPDQVSRSLSARAQLEQTIQISTNLGRTKTEVDTAEQALSTAVNVLQRVNTLGAQGATGTQTVDQRRTLALEVSAALESMVAIAGTVVEGRNIFSGDADQTPPYAFDLIQPNGVTPYAGGPATREIPHPSGTRIAISHSGQDIFDSSNPGESVFGAMNQLRLALEAVPAVPVGDPAYQAQYAAQTAAITTALETVRTAQSHLSNELAYYGTIQNRVAEAAETTKKLELRQRTELSDIQDADVAAAALELAKSSTHRDASLAARAKQAGRSLFDYL